MPVIWDHLLLVFVIVLYPAFSAYSIGRVLDYIEQQGSAARIQVYRQIIITWLSFALIIVGYWLLSGRELAQLGFQWGSATRTLIALAIASGVLLAVVYPMKRALDDKDASKKLLGVFQKQLGRVFIIMPSSPVEERWFYRVSLNAGVSEEIIFRGFLLWYLTHYFSELWAAVLAVLLFSLAHLYQGIRNQPALIVISAATVVMYVITGSLLVPILFHILLDVFQGRYIARLQRLELS